MLSLVRSITYITYKISENYIKNWAISSFFFLKVHFVTIIRRIETRRNIKVNKATVAECLHNTLQYYKTLKKILNDYAIFTLWGRGFRIFPINSYILTITVKYERFYILQVFWWFSSYGKGEKKSLKLKPNPNLWKNIKIWIIFLYNLFNKFKVHVVWHVYHKFGVIILIREISSGLL